MAKSWYYPPAGHPHGQSLHRSNPMPDEMYWNSYIYIYNIFTKNHQPYLYLVGVLEYFFMTFYEQLGISSSQLLRTPSFFSGLGQPPTSYSYSPSLTIIISITININYINSILTIEVGQPPTSIFIYAILIFQSFGECWAGPQPRSHPRHRSAMSSSPRAVMEGHPQQFGGEFLVTWVCLKIGYSHGVSCKKAKNIWYSMVIHGILGYHGVYKWL